MKTSKHDARIWPDQRRPELPLGPLDIPVTCQKAADDLGLPVFKVQRAARQGIIPTYSLLNSRKYVKLRDILAVMGIEVVDSGEGHRHD